MLRASAIVALLMAIAATSFGADAPIELSSKWKLQSTLSLSAAMKQIAGKSRPAGQV
jgi:hypothetical protein